MGMKSRCLGIWRRNTNLIPRFLVSPPALRPLLVDLAPRRQLDLVSSQPWVGDQAPLARVLVDSARHLLNRLVEALVLAVLLATHLARMQTARLVVRALVHWRTHLARLLLVELLLAVSEHRSRVSAHPPVASQAQLPLELQDAETSMKNAVRPICPAADLSGSLFY